MDDTGDWYDVLICTDVDTAQLIVDLQLLDLEELSRCSKSSPSCSVDKVATKLLECEIATCNAHLPDRKLAEDLEDMENDLEAALEWAAFSWT